ncbi:MAG: ABC transporter substrate-binding protein [Alphaproteobacteria bacterium]|nr:ABC transporter substrate-binding protein [Alphaproteobacteria bacterium]
MTSLSVRAVVSAAFVGAAAMAAAAQAQVTITVNGSGGGLAQTITRIYEEPFTRATGIKVRATAPVSLPKLKAMVESGNVEWDMTELGGSDVIEATRHGWLQPVDWSFVDPDGKLPAIARLPNAMVTATFSTVLAYRTDKFPAGKGPASWADFWNVQAFPGPRALQSSPVGNLEFALLADGVAPDKLYPLDVERAFRKLDQIKPHVTVWWTTGAQHVQLLIDGEVVMTSVWNGRITPLRREGKPVAISYQGGALQLSYWGIPKGAKHPKEAMTYMRTRLDPEKGKQFVSEVPYPGFIPGLIELLDPAVARDLPTHPDNVAMQYRFDPQWWAERRAPLTERWNAWLLQ